MNINEIVEYSTDSGNVKLSAQIVRNMIAIGKNIEDAEIVNFMMMCQYRRLNPFLKQAYLVKFGETVQIIVSKDVFTQRLNLHPQCEGWEAGVIVWNKDGKKIIERVGTFFLDDTEKLVGAYFILHRKGWKEPFKWTIKLKDYFRTYKNKNGTIEPMGNWATMPGVMLVKCVTVAGIRNVFSEEFGGMYTDDELGIDKAIDVTPINKTKSDKKKDKNKKEETFISQVQIGELCALAASKSKELNYNADDLLKYAMELLVNRGSLKSVSKKEIPKKLFADVYNFIKSLIDTKEKKERKENNTTNENKENNTTNENKENNTTNENKENNTTNETKENNTTNETKENDENNNENNNGTPKVER